MTRQLTRLGENSETWQFDDQSTRIHEHAQVHKRDKMGQLQTPTVFVIGSPQF